MVSQQLLLECALAGAAREARSHLEVASEVVEPEPESLQLGFRVHAWREGAALPHLHPTTLCDGCADNACSSCAGLLKRFSNSLTPSKGADPQEGMFC